MVGLGSHRWRWSHEQPQSTIHSMEGDVEGRFRPLAVPELCHGPIHAAEFPSGDHISGCSAVWGESDQAAVADLNGIACGTSGQCNGARNGSGWSSGYHQGAAATNPAEGC